jgi:hypothetical protein
MKRSVGAALLLTAITIPVCAQRVSSHSMASHGESSVHSSQGVRGEFSAPAPARSGGMRTAPTRGYAASRPLAAQRGEYGRPGIGSNGVGFGGPRRPYPGPSRYRRPYVTSYGWSIPYGAVGYGYPGLIGPGYGAGYGLGYADDSDSGGDDPSPAAPAADAGEGPDQDGGQPEGQSLPPWPYGGSQSASAPSSPTSQPGQDGVTIVFKDGRPPEQIRNFILTRTMLYVGDGRHPDIPVDALDLVATVKVNREAGVDFRLP